MSKPFLILSMDGGGLRGIVPALILKAIEQRTNKRIQDIFHLAAGTSTGGLIACGLSVTDDGKTPLYSIDDIINVYVQEGKTIFPQTQGLFNKIKSGIDSLFDPKFSANGIEQVLTKMFGTRTMSKNTMMPFLVTTYDLASNSPLFFKSRYISENKPELDTQLYNICRATSAAPTYLPAFQMNYNNMARVCIDGGVYINNPGMAAVSEMSKNGKEPYYNRPDLQFSDLFMLSLGTGTYTENLAKQKWMQGGLVDWAQPVSEIMMQSVNQSTVYECREMLEKDQYLRFQVSIDNEKYSNMADSSDATRNYITNLVNTQIINNPAAMASLDAFLKKAGVIPGAAPSA